MLKILNHTNIGGDRIISKIKPEMEQVYIPRLIISHMYFILIIDKIKGKLFIMGLISNANNKKIPKRAANALMNFTKDSTSE